MTEKKYYFYDLQTGGNSAHNTLDGLCDMLLDDIRSWLGTSEEQDGDREFIESFERGEWSDDRKLDWIKTHEYEPQEVTDELLSELGITREDFEEFGWSALDY